MKWKWQLQLQLKDNFFHYYIETFLSRNNFLDILLVFVSFLQICCGIYSSYILFFIFFLLQMSFYINFLLSLLISLHYCYSNLLLYLVTNLCFFDGKLNQYSHLFLNITKKKNYKTLLLSTKLELFIMLIASNHYSYHYSNDYSTIFFKNGSDSHSH